MKTIEMQETLNWPAAQIWGVISDIGRCDWVPSVDAITVDGDIRSFTMDNIGEVQEQILQVDHGKMLLQYSAIKTPSMVSHHLATIQLTAQGENCLLTWTTEIEPEQFAPAIEHGMTISLQGLQKVLASTPDKPGP